jgi:hypothetical protein
MFYINWKSQLDVLSDKELRRFVNKLISWHQDGKIELKTKTDLLVWNGVLPGLEVNNEKWNTRAETSRENGKKSNGRPPKPELTQQVIEKPTKPVNSKKLNVESKTVKGNGKEKIDKSEMLNDNVNKQDISSIKLSSEGQSITSYYRNNINRIESELKTRYPHLPFLLTMANPTGIKELRNHIDEKDDLEYISSLLKELTESKYKLRGRYD